jgi:hypothetical protein
MSAETFKVPVLSSGALDWKLEEVPSHFTPTPFASITVLTGGVERDAARGITRVELRSGAWWSCRVELSDDIVSQRGAPSVLALAWTLAGDPTPEIHKKAMRDLNAKNEMLHADVRQLIAERDEARRDAADLQWQLRELEEAAP